MKQPHPHADLMMQFVKEAAVDIDAYKNWQVNKNTGNGWNDLMTSPSWLPNYSYRRKPEHNLVPTQVLTDDQIKKITKDYRLRIFSTDIFADTFIEMARTVIEFHEKVKQANQAKDM